MDVRAAVVEAMRALDPDMDDEPTDHQVLAFVRRLPHRLRHADHWRRRVGCYRRELAFSQRACFDLAQEVARHRRNVRRYVSRIEELEAALNVGYRGGFLAKRSGALWLPVGTKGDE
jgi:hypothetical protein